MSEQAEVQEIDDQAIARLPEILYHNEADALYGPAVTDEAKLLSFQGHMAELTDKMVLEVGTMFDDDGIFLDYSDESFEDLDKLISQVWGVQPPDEPEVLDAIVANWGAYLGEALLENLGGKWRFRQDLDHASVYFPRTQMEVFPMHKLRKRFRLGESESLVAFYEAIIDELTAED